MWEPITDLTPADKALASSEFAALQALWNEERGQLAEQGILDRFISELQREWAVETGLVERLYTFDRGVTLLLIERGIDAALIPHSAGNEDPSLVAAIIQDQLDVAEGLFQFVRGERELSESYVKELHAALTEHQATTKAIDALGKLVDVELARGRYKDWPNNPTRPDSVEHVYCPPEQVAPEMERLLGWHTAHQADGVAPEIQAAWLHHRFTQIHPFQDGNGRVARALAGLVFIKAGLFPPVVRDDEDRRNYIDALENADDGNLGPLVALFVKVEKRALIRALSLGERIADEAREVGQVIDRLVQDVAARPRAEANGFAEAAELAGVCQQRATRRLSELRDMLIANLGTAKFRFRVDDRADGVEGSHWYRAEIIDAARALGYFANFDTFRAWSRLKLEDVEAGFRDELIVSFHGIGPRYRGALGASALLKRRLESEGEHEPLVEPLSDELFTISAYGGAGTERSFDEWLERALIRGLEIWRRAVSSGGSPSASDPA